MSGKLEIYCQYKADNVNRIGLNDEPIKPYANYFVPRRGYQETFANWEAKEKGAYPLQAYTPHYMRRAHTCYDNMTWTQEAFRNPVFMSVEDAEARGIKAGDTVRCFNDFGSMLRIAQPMQGYMPGVVGIPPRCALGVRRVRPREHHRPRRQRADALRWPAVELLPPGGRLQQPAHRDREVRR